MKKDREIKSDLELMFRRADNQSKVMQIWRRLTAYILAAVGVSAKIKALDEVAHAAFPKRDTNRPVHDGLWQHFAKSLFELEEVGLLFQYFRISTDGNGSKDGEITDPAKSRVILEFFRAVGGNVELSIKFGLQLLEEYGVLLQKLYDNESTTSAAIARSNGTVALHVLRDSASAPPHIAIPQRQWFVNIIHAAADGNEGADQVLAYMMTILSETAKMQLKIAAINPLNLPKPLRMDHVSLLKKETGDPHVFLSHEEKQWLDSWGQKLTARNAVHRAAGKKILDWVAGHHDEFQRAVDMRRTAIATNPRRGLRPGGSDMASIRVAPVYNAGVRALAFFPDDRMFPDTGVRIMISTTSPHLIAFHSEMAGLRLQIRTGALDNHSHDPDKVMEVLEFVVLDIMYNLVSVPTITNSTSRSGGKKQNGESGREEHSTHPVRPHLRILLPGQKASIQATSAASQHMGWRLPPGMTFVRAHYRGDPSGTGGQIEHDITTPTIDYSDESFFDAMGVPLP